MYSGTIIHKKSGRVMGAHQRIDRVARRHLVRQLPAHALFPSIRDILHFEGLNGPDGIKRKSPGRDEPWHHINPTDPNDTGLIELLHDHRYNLVAALRAGDETRAAFEAAWLAHALVDGLTPAHHYPLGEKIEELWGKPHEERLSVREKMIIRGSTRRDTVQKNWQYWGAKGVWSTHFMFEWGVASAIVTMRFDEYAPSLDWLEENRTKGLEAVFQDALEAVAALDMYHTFWTSGWNATLARQTRKTLIPLIINLVTFAWYDAYSEAAGL